MGATLSKYDMNHEETQLVIRVMTERWAASAPEGGEYLRLSGLRGTAGFGAGDGERYRAVNRVRMDAVRAMMEFPDPLCLAVAAASGVRRSAAGDALLGFDDEHKMYAEDMIGRSQSVSGRNRRHITMVARPVRIAWLFDPDGPGCHVAVLWSEDALGAAGVAEYASSDEAMLLNVKGVAEDIRVQAAGPAGEILSRATGGLWPDASRLRRTAWRAAITGPTDYAYPADDDRLAAIPEGIPRRIWREADADGRGLVGATFHLPVVAAADRP